MLLCPIEAINRCLRRMEQFRLECYNLFVLTTKRKDSCSEIPFFFSFFFIRVVISHAYCQSLMRIAG